jgi:hypothetical protein
MFAPVLWMGRGVCFRLGDKSLFGFPFFLRRRPGRILEARFFLHESQVHGADSAIALLADDRLRIPSAWLSSL